MNILKIYLSTSLLSALMTYLKNILNGPDPGGQMMDMTQNYSLWLLRVIFLEKLKTTEAYEYAQNITWVLLLYQLWWYMSKTCQIGLIQGVKWWIWPKMIHFDHLKVIFLEKLKTTEEYEYA